ncbi:hypothetical protein SBV1_180015 [Verrucomicrobia bacterium]|nr:hypothetical protein SBV1_180015 [Verrucomicrobiota bacterium]
MRGRDVPAPALGAKHIQGTARPGSTMLWGSRPLRQRIAAVSREDHDFCVSLTQVQVTGYPKWPKSADKSRWHTFCITLVDMKDRSQGIPVRRGLKSSCGCPDRFV